MDWLSILGLGGLADRWRAGAAEAALAVQERSLLLRLELREYGRHLGALVALALCLAALTVVVLTVVSAAVMVHFWDSPDRVLVAWCVAAAWLVAWCIAAAVAWSLARKVANGFAHTRQVLAQDWQDLKELL